MYTRDELLALSAGTRVEVDLGARTYMGPLIDDRSGWVSGTVHGVSETLNGEINLWVDIPYPEGLSGRDGSSSHREHFTATSRIVRPPKQ